MISTSNVLIEQGPSTSSRQRPLTVGISLNDDTLSSISTGNHSPVSDYGAGGVGGGGICSTGTYPQVCLPVAVLPYVFSSALDGVFSSQELIDNLGVNLHRIDKDVLRCDRNMAYFTTANLEKLRNVASPRKTAKVRVNHRFIIGLYFCRLRPTCGTIWRLVTCRACATSWPPSLSPSMTRR